MDYESFGCDDCEGDEDRLFRPDKAEELKGWVENAFTDVIYPGDDNITISACPCQECCDTRELFRGKHWREMAGSGQPLQHVGWGGLAIMSPQAWRFYLPAYLSRGLSESDDAENALTSTLYSLAPDTRDQSSRSHDFLAERISGLSVAQQVCIAAYSSAAVEAGATDEAFRVAAAYWKGRVAETGADLEAV